MRIRPIPLAGPDIRVKICSVETGFLEMTSPPYAINSSLGNWAHYDAARSVYR
jgi:hypothetical protein